MTARRALQPSEPESVGLRHPRAPRGDEHVAVYPPEHIRVYADTLHVTAAVGASAGSIVRAELVGSRSGMPTGGSGGRGADSDEMTEVSYLLVSNIALGNHRAPAPPSRPLLTCGSGFPCPPCRSRRAAPRTGLARQLHPSPCPLPSRSPVYPTPVQHPAGSGPVPNLRAQGPGRLVGRLPGTPIERRRGPPRARLARCPRPAPHSLRHGTRQPPTAVGPATQRAGLPTVPRKLTPHARESTHLSALGAVGVGELTDADLYPGRRSTWPRDGMARDRCSGRAGSGPGAG